MKESTVVKKLDCQRLAEVTTQAAGVLIELAALLKQSAQENAQEVTQTEGECNTTLH